jgi:PilZ domain
MYPELRNERRFRCEARVVGAGLTAFAGTVRDLSSSGLCLTTDTPIEPGSQLHLEFDLLAGRVSLVGEVRRVTTSEDGLIELGVRFVRLSADAQQAIRFATGG